MVFCLSAPSYICENEAIPMPPHWENACTELPYWWVRAAAINRLPAGEVGKDRGNTLPTSFQLIALHSQTHEYNEVASLFGKTMDQQN